MTTYGISHYGKPNLYGPSRAATVVPGGPSIPLINNAYLIDPFTATPIDYFSVLLRWNGPDPTTNTPMNEFRLLSSRYGFPVDENDGNVLFDTTSLPGSQFVDQTVVPGEISYYGFYILGANSQWIRAGFTACLMPVNHGYAAQLWNWLPAYLRDVQDSELTADAAGDTFLSQFLGVAGWSLDYLKTQYDFLFTNQNDAMTMSFSDLADLAGQLGMPFSGEIPAYFLRKAAENWATVMRQRGSLAGIAEHASLLSGYTADLQISRNIMLENDQSDPADPVPMPWSGGIPYRVGEHVLWPVYPEWVQSQAYIVNNFVVYNGVNYSCTATGGQGVPPTGAVNSSSFWAIASGPFVYQCSAAITSFPGTAPPAAPVVGSSPNPSNSNWTLVYDADATTAHLAITGLSGGVNTWEVLGASGTTPSTAAVAAGTLTEGIGTHNPSNFGNDFSQNTFRVYNKSGATTDQWLRSVSREAADITAGSAVPDPQTVIEHAIPVPQTNTTLNGWNSTTRYGTGTVVRYNGRNYLALRASTGATPPASGSTAEWQTLGTDSRIPLMISAQVSQNLSQAASEPFAITPFVEWYDNWGKLITRVFARTLSNYAYDSFTGAPGTALNGRTTDAGAETWNATGGWELDGNGNAYPTSSGAMALVAAPLSCTQGVTFTETPQTGMDSGLIFWWQSSTLYWHAGMAGLWYKNGSTWTEAVTYASAFAPGDRIYVVTSQSTPSITVYRNSLTSTPVATLTGAGVPSAVLPSGSATVYSGIASETV